MQQSPIIQSTIADDGRFWAIRKIDDGYQVGLWRRKSNHPSNISTHEQFMSALIRLSELAGRSNLTIDWSTFTITCTPLIVVQSEYKGMAREHVSTFFTQEDYDTFRRERLANYDVEEDAADVKRLLEAGKIDEAWEMSKDDDGSKELWNTSFGSHYTENVENKVAFNSLPDWLKSLVKEAV